MTVSRRFGSGTDCGLEVLRAATARPRRELVLLIASLGLLGGCDRGTFAPPEAGVYRFDGAMIMSRDAGRTDPPRDAGRTPDAGRDAGAQRQTLTVSVRGARVASFDYDDEDNFVSCVRGTSDGFFNVSGNVYAGGPDRLSFSIRDYHGPDSYNWTWRGGSGGPSGDLTIDDSYSYWFFYDYSSSSFVDVPATCAMDVVSLGDGWIEGSLSCDRWTAQITSPDYDRRDTAGYRPYVSLDAQFRCTLD